MVVASNDRWLANRGGRCGRWWQLVAVDDGNQQRPTAVNGGLDGS